MRSKTITKILLIAIGFSLVGCSSKMSFLSKQSVPSPTNELNSDGAAPDPQPSPQPNPSGGIQIVNHRGCYAVSPVPAVYSFNSGYVLTNNDSISWVLAPVSKSSGRLLQQAQNSADKVSGTFTKTTFSNGKPRWRELESQVYSLPVDLSKLQQLQDSAQSLDNGVVMYIAYTKFGAIASSELSPASLNIQAIKVLEGSAPRYSFQTFTALVAPRNECLDGTDGDEHEVCEDECDSNESPLVLDFKGNGVSATSVEKGVAFDLNADGILEKTAWLSPNKDNQLGSLQKLGFDDVFLARDINKDGRIESGRELFGQATVLENGSTSVNGFIALSDLDSNRDGVFDNKDHEFKNLLLWDDRNHNGKSERVELHMLSDHVNSINLKFEPTNETDEFGNKIFARSSFRTKLDKTKPIVDIYFKFESGK